ncbi:hypothetical protein MPL1_02021 [Methylophaga lonarensis MPL]|uniref:DUF4168 domain-containing protein n=1 Tax=Methylophaga lonarensis MPL TaxID=1286106 RepID=M7P3E2_9GAMM|nr:DUF4168 domain-containing protein [Methylophaga lonarensis]EMR14036.1 hypothetical protein MPL1_02021 [Methylophaga lonarensis MPL]
MKKLSTSLLGMMMAMGMTTAAYAQQDGYGEAYGEQGVMPQQAPAAADFDDAELQSFAAVQSDLDVIRNEYSARLESTENPDEAAQLQQEASQLMVQAVEQAGLDVDTYSNIALALQTDPQLRDRIQSMM